MTFLLDLNLLFILHQPRHAGYKLAQRWLESKSKHRFATCPMTQTGVIRLLTQEIEGLDRFSIQEACEALRALVLRPAHVFWPDAPPWLEAADNFLLRMQGHRQAADAYLLGVAIHNHGKLATLDRGIRHLAGRELGESVELVGN